MTASQESLLHDEENASQQQQHHHHQQHAQNESRNPIQMQQRRHQDAIQQHPSMPTELKLSGSMKANHADGTLVILNSRAQVYTEIPFAAIHGMQTRQRDNVDVFEYPRDGSGAFSEMPSMGDEKSAVLQALPSAATFEDSTPTISTSSLTSTLVIATICNSLSQFLVGYNMVVLNTPEPYVFPGHSTLAWSWAVAALAIGAPFGSLLGGSLSDSVGRKMTLQINSAGFLAAGIFQAWAPSLSFLTLARFLLGLQSGIATVLVPIYLGEVAPPHLRGTLGTVNQFALVVGILAADLLSFPFANADGWRFLLAVTTIVATFQLLLTPFLVESPRFLLHKPPRVRSECQDVLKRLRGYTSQEEIDKEVETYLMVDAIQSCRSTSTLDVSNADDDTPILSQSNMNSKTTIFWELLTIPYVRFLFLCSILLHVGQQLCGVSAVFYYSTSLFQEIGIRKSLVGTTTIGVVNVVFTYVALLLMDSYKRKTLVLLSIGGMLVSCVGLIASHNFLLQPVSLLSSSSSSSTGDSFNDDIGKDYDDFYSYPEDYEKPSSVLVLTSINAYVAFYAIGFGPIPFLWIAEMVSPRYVALTMSICSQLNWVVNFLVGLVFPLMKERMGSWVFVPFAFALCICFLFVWNILPEKRRRMSPFFSADESKRQKFTIRYQS